MGRRDRLQNVNRPRDRDSEADADLRSARFGTAPAHESHQQQQRYGGGDSAFGTAMSRASMSTSHRVVPRTHSIEKKKAFMLNSFQFILTPEAAEQQAHAGPNALAFRCDEMPPWECVAYVGVRELVNDYQCPVCLDTPVVPRITECGHVYCFSCILRHIRSMKALDKSTTCPVCSTIVVVPTLRPALWSGVVPIGVGSRVSLMLAQRDVDSCQVTTNCTKAVGGGVAAEAAAAVLATLPSEALACGGGLSPLRTQLHSLMASVAPGSASAAGGGATGKSGGGNNNSSNNNGNALPVWSDADACFARYFQPHPTMAADVREAEEAALAVFTADLHDEAAAVMAAAPQSAASAAAPATSGAGGGRVVPGSSPAQPQPPSQQGAARGAVPLPPELLDAEGLSVLEEVRQYVTGTHPKQLRQQRTVQSTGRNVVGAVTPASLASQPAASSAAALPTGLLHGAASAASGAGSGLLRKPPQLFFRCADGQALYMHPLNMVMLRDDAAARGAPLPRVLDVTILEVETVMQTPHTRQCFKPFAHVPLGASFVLCVVDLTGIVGDATLAAYRPRLEARKERLRELASRQDEEAECAAAEAWERHKRGSAASSAGGGSTDSIARRLLEWGAESPTVSPELIASMPTLEEAMPRFELPTSSAGGATPGGTALAAPPQQQATPTTATRGAWGHGSESIVRNAATTKQASAPVVPSWGKRAFGSPGSSAVPTGAVTPTSPLPSPVPAAGAQRGSHGLEGSGASGTPLVVRAALGGRGSGGSAAGSVTGSVGHTSSPEATPLPVPAAAAARFVDPEKARLEAHQAVAAAADAADAAAQLQSRTTAKKGGRPKPTPLFPSGRGR